MNVELPFLAEGVEGGDVVQVLVHEGDQVTEGQSLIELETDKPITPDALAGVEGVNGVRQLAPRRLNVVTADAGRTTPRLVEALGAMGVNVLDADEYQPSFDEVFAELVERRRSERRQSAEDAA